MDGINNSGARARSVAMERHKINNNRAGRVRYNGEGEQWSGGEVNNNGVGTG